MPVHSPIMNTSPLHQYLHAHKLALVDTGDTTKGRTVVARETLRRGSDVIHAYPLGTVPLQGSQREYCNYCFRKLRTHPDMGPLQCCSRCRSAYFCDMTCFKNAWLSYHQFVCRPPGGSVSPSGISDSDKLDLEMLERVALNVSRCAKQQPHMDDGTVPDNDRTDALEESVDVTIEAFHSLMDHHEHHPHDVLANYARIADMALQKPYLRDLGWTQQALIQFLCRFHCNNFAISDEQLFAIGEGTYPVASLFNHSCHPNAAVLFDGSLLIIKAIADIQPGQEVTIAYIDAARSRTHRANTLQSKYFFTCHCERCDDNSPLHIVDVMLGEEEELDPEQQQRAFETQSAQLIRIVQDWNLVELTRKFNRKNNAVPDVTQPLTLPYYVHFMLQLLTPYLWSASSNTIRFLSPTASPKSTSSSSSSSSHHLTEFDDPPVAKARPRPKGETYASILSETIKQAMTYPEAPDLVPYRIVTVATATRLFYDEMTAGRWANATRLGMYILVQYSILYPPYHPMLAQHLLLLAKAAWNSSVQNELVTNGRKLESSSERGIRRWILLAKETISCTFGKQSNMWREAIELEWIFMREQSLK